MSKLIDFGVLENLLFLSCIQAVQYSNSGFVAFCSIILSSYHKSLDNFWTVRPILTKFGM